MANFNLTKWTDADITELLRLWATGQSATQIAVTLSEVTGRAMTRSSVLGKLHRLGELGERTAHHSPHAKKALATGQVEMAGPKPQPKPKRQPVATERQPLALSPKEQRSLEAAFAAKLPEPKGKSKTILQVGDRECRFSTGELDGVAVFCAELTADSNRSFCDHHHARCYYKPAKRGRSKEEAGGMAHTLRMRADLAARREGFRNIHQ